MPGVKNLLFLFLGFICLSILAVAVHSPKTVEWTMWNVNEGNLQADAHLLKMPEGSAFLIDCGDPYGTLASFLKKKKVLQVEKVLISHAHKDHYAGLLSVLDAGIQVKEVYFNVPSRKVCDTEKNWGCDWDKIQEFLAALKAKQIPVLSYSSGKILFQQGGTRLETLYAFDGETTPIGATTVNDMSAILLLQHGKTRALFTGDLGEGIGKYLAENGKRLQADILKIPHHGGKPVPPDHFFDRVSPKAVLIPAPRWLWKDGRSNQVRNYLKEKKIPTYISGVDGKVEVTLLPEGFRISSENKKNFSTLP